MPYHFTQPCPTCGRQLRIAIDLLGREVGCQHCGAEFTGGCDGSSANHATLEAPLLERVEAILRRSDEYVHAAPLERPPH